MKNKVCPLCQQTRAFHPGSCPALVSLWLPVQAGGRQIGGEGSRGCPSDALSRHQLGDAHRAPDASFLSPLPHQPQQELSGTAAMGTAPHSLRDDSLTSHCKQNSIKEQGAGCRSSTSPRVLRPLRQREDAWCSRDPPASPRPVGEHGL